MYKKKCDHLLTYMTKYKPKKDDHIRKKEMGPLINK